MLSKIVHSRITSAVLGLILIAYAVYDIYEEFFELTHEHILIGVGILLLISGVAHLTEGINEVMHTITPKKDIGLIKRLSDFFHLNWVRLILGATVLITASYGLYEDVEKMHSKTVSISVGLLMMLLPLFKAYTGGENLIKGIRKRDDS